MRQLLFIVLLATSTLATAGQPPVRLLLGGDVMFGRNSTDGYRLYPANELEQWRALMRTADVGLLNLETGICDEGRSVSKLPLLWAPPERLSELGPRTVVSIANNHALDCGADGVTQTERHLDKRGIPATGRRGEPALVVDDIAFLAGTMHPPPYRAKTGTVNVVREPRALIDDVAKLRKQRPAGAIVVSLHWGKERSARVAEWQRVLARDLVTAGATVVAGHGPHVPQMVERIDGALVFYSLGNLAFDDRTPTGAPSPPRLVVLTKSGGEWRAELDTPVASD